MAAYRRDLRRYARFLASRGRTSFGQVTEEDVASYVEAVRTGADGGHPLSPTSTSRAVVAVRGWHRFSRLEGHTDTDPAAAVRPPGTTKRLPKAIAVEEVDKLLAGASMAEGVLGLRDRALVEVLYGTGARISEAVGLAVDDVDIDVQHPSLRLFGKGAKNVSCPSAGSRWRRWKPTWCAPGRCSPSPGAETRRCS